LPPINFLRFLTRNISPPCLERTEIAVVLHQVDTSPTDIESHRGKERKDTTEKGSVQTEILIVMSVKDDEHPKTPIAGIANVTDVATNPGKSNRRTLTVKDER
jgi:hypothetical protein